MEVFKIIVLSLSGLLLLFVGAMRLYNPQKTYLKHSGIQLANDVNLLNEMKGISAVMLLGGLVVLSGIFWSELTTSSFVVTIIIFIGFALGRSISIGTDGQPNKQITQGIITEIILGLANSYCLISTFL